MWEKNDSDREKDDKAGPFVLSSPIDLAGKSTTLAIVGPNLLIIIYG
jgi:hypothetical protein